MIKHIVMWRLKDENKQRNIRRIKRDLEALQGIVPGFLAIEVGVDLSSSSDSSDIVLYCKFDDQEALETYQNHPRHKAIVPLVSEARTERRVVNYEC